MLNNQALLTVGGDAACIGARRNANTLEGDASSRRRKLKHKKG